jgi:hypothetical protein
MIWYELIVIMSDLILLMTHVFYTGAVDGNGPSTSYSSASNGAEYFIQRATSSLHNAPNNRAYNSIATHTNTSGEACGLGQNAQNMYENPNRFNGGFTTQSHYGGGGGSTIYQHGNPNLPPIWPPYPALNNLPDPTNIHDNASITSSSTSYHASPFTNVPQTHIQDYEYNMQLNSGRIYNVRFLALRQPPPNMFSGSVYQAPQGGIGNL